MNTLSSIFIGFGLTISSLSIFMINNSASAQQGGDRLTNDEYIIDQGSLKYGSDEPSDGNSSPNSSAKGGPQGTAEGSNYSVRSGSQYYYSAIPFEFSLSSQFIDFGPLVPGSPVTRTNRVRLSNGSAFGYEVLAYEKNALRVDSSGDDIPDTTCDAGVCSETTSAEWSQNTTFGFGYRCDNISGSECAPGFANPTEYKQFANIEQNERPQAIMSGNGPGEGFEAEIEYKINISSNQASGLYRNEIVYIAVPSIQ